MKSLTLISTSFPDGQPGSEAAGSFVADFALELAKHVPVSVIAPSLSNSVQDVGLLRIHRFAVPRLPLSLLNPFNPKDWAAITKTIRAGTEAVHHIAQTIAPSHVLALWALPSGHWARQMAKVSNCNYSIWALGSDIWALGKIPIINHFLTDILRGSSICFADGIELCDAVTQLSNRSCEFLPSIRRMPISDICGRALSPTPPFRYVFIGRWHTNKGVDILLEALHEFDDSDWSQIASVKIFGGGPLESQVRKSVSMLQTANRPVTTEGYIDKLRATKEIIEADFLLLPSRIESIPVIFSDAMQCQRPLISTPIGDLPSLLVERNVGILAHSTSALDYAKAIRSSFKINPNTFCDSLRRTRDEFSLESAAQRLISRLQDV